MPYSIRFTPAFTTRLNDVTAYIKEELGLPQSAATLLDELEAKLAVLAEFPRAYMVDEEASKAIGTEVRGVNVCSFKLLYWIDDTERAILPFALRFHGEDPKLLQKYRFL